MSFTAVGQVTKVAAAAVDFRVPVVRQFHLGLLVTGRRQEYQGEAALFAVAAAEYLQAQGVAVEGQRGVQIGDTHHRVQVFHGVASVYWGMVRVRVMGMYSPAWLKSPSMRTGLPSAPSSSRMVP
jgi:hypothetical protein